MITHHDICCFSRCTALKPGSTIGILGGGQLGRMLAQAAARLGLHVHIYCPNPKAPAFEVASSKTIAQFEDREALLRVCAQRRCRDL